MLELLKEAIKINRANRIKHDADKFCCDLETYSMNFALISINLGRCTGKSTAIAELVTNRDAVICSSVNIFKRKPANIITNSAEFDKSVKLFNIIFIDEPTLLVKQNFLSMRNRRELIITVIYKFIRNYEQTIILLGE